MIYRISELAISTLDPVQRFSSMKSMILPHDGACTRQAANSH